MNFYFDLVKQFSKKYFLPIFICLMLISILTLDVYHIFFQDKTFKNLEEAISLLKKEENNLEINNNSDTSKDNSSSNQASLEENKESKVAKYYIDIKGFVKKPGVYEVTADNIVNDCIKLAGGLLKNADTTTINLSKKVSSEMVIYIPKKEEVIKTTTNTTVTKDQEIPNDAVVSDNNKSNSSISKDNNTKTPNRTLVNINTATIQELTTLSGIGEAKAQDIIDYRILNGNFKTIEDIKNVSGIGEALYAKIKDYITV